MTLAEAIKKASEAKSFDRDYWYHLGTTLEVHPSNFFLPDSTAQCFMAARDDADILFPSRCAGNAPWGRCLNALQLGVEQTLYRAYTAASHERKAKNE